MSKITLLNDVCELIVDCEHKTAPIKAEGFPSIRTPNIERGRFILEDVNRVSLDTYRKWTKRALPREDDLILAREAPVGNVAIIKKNQKFCLGQRTVLIRPNKKKIDPKFLLYYLLSEDIQNNFLSRSIGSTVAHLNMSDIRNLKMINIPDAKTQIKIGEILQNYNELIEKNFEKIKTLEKIILLTYENYFEKKNEKEINITEFIDFEKGVEPGSKNYEKKNDLDNSLIPFIRVGDLIKPEATLFVNENFTKNKICEENDILLSLDGSVGRVVVGLKGCYSTGIRKIKKKVNCPFGTSFLFCYFKSQKIQNLIKAHARGTTILHASSAINYMKCFVPDKSILDDFEEKTQSFIKEMINLKKINITLNNKKEILIEVLFNKNFKVLN